MSVLIITNAKRVWVGGPTRQSDVVVPTALLCLNNIIEHVGDDRSVLLRVAELLPPLRSRLGDSSDAILESLRTLAAVNLDGSDHNILLLELSGTEMVSPGFVDSHVHLLDGGKRLTSVSLRHCRSKEMFVATLREFIAVNAVPAGQWITGGDWSEVGLGAMPHRSWIDEATTSHFVLLARMDSHAAVVNSMTMDACPELSERGFVIAGGSVEFDADGCPTGLLKEKAVGYVKRKLWPPRDTEANMRKALHASGEYLLRNGITFVHSMSSLDFSNTSELEFLLERELEDGRLPVRVRSAIRVTELEEYTAKFGSIAATSTPPSKDGTDGMKTFDVRPAVAIRSHSAAKRFGGFLRIGAVKFFSDGSLGSKTAAMKEPYCGTCQCGYLLQPAEELYSGMQVAAGAGMQCCVHAIGDAAVATVVEGFETIVERRHRVEHCQHLDRESDVVAAMARLRVIASCQPCHLLFDGDYAGELLGSERMASSYMFRSLSSHGVQLALGSDWMVAPANVMDGIRAAVTRIPDAVDPRHHHVWNESERLTIEEALIGFTYGGAFAGFSEHEMGTLKRGMLADVVVLSNDLLEGSDWTDKKAQTQVLHTIVDGRVVYSAV